MSLLPLLVQLVCGAAGGNIAAKIFKNLDLGTVGNSIAGIVGGGLGGQLLNMIGLGGGTGTVDIGNLLGSVAAGGVGGGVVMAIVGAIKGAMGGAKPAAR